jgi:hypothetical protein
VLVCDGEGGELTLLAPLRRCAASRRVAFSPARLLFDRSISMHIHTSPGRARTARTAVAALIAAAGC